MDNKTGNKLILTSGADSGKEYYLLHGRTTVGSAPDNDMQLNEQGVSGFHAEIRNDNNSFLIFDFNSEKGTFVNEERITEEKQLSAGDRIQMGSVRAVFLPRNGIIAKEYKPRVNLHELLKSVEPYYKKWMNDKNRKILACILPAIAVLMIALAMSNNRSGNQENKVARHARRVHSENISNSVNGAKKKIADRSRNALPTIENGSLSYMPNGAAVASVGGIRNQSGPRPRDRFADIYFNIANKFADHQLWQIALEYYYRVFEKNPDHPELSAYITEMKSEINNQITYEEGQALIKKKHYKEGIANLHRIPENSYYFYKAAQVIVEAEENASNEKL